MITAKDLFSGAGGSSEGLRAFVAECDGLPDELLVRIEWGSLSEGGLRDVTLSATYTHPDANAAVSGP